MVSSGRFIRFIIVGSVNTFVTWVLFLALNFALDYRVSYSISFVFGVFFSYFLNAAWVFGSKYNLKSALRYPLVYVVQYIYGLAAIWMLVDIVGIARGFSLLIVVGTSIPLTFLMMKLVFRGAVSANG